HVASSEFLPAGPVPARVDVNERSVPGSGAIQASTAYQLRISPLDSLLCVEDDPGVVDIDAAVMVEVVHDAVGVVVDEDVRRVAIHVAAESGASARFAAGRVVLRSPETAHDVH